MQADSLAKISSGTRIVRASDDAAGLAVGMQLQSDVTTLKQASINLVQATATLNIADSALARIGDILNRARSIVVQAISGAVDNVSRGFMNAEIQHLAQEIDLLRTATTFNGKQIINADYNENFQSGINAASDVITIDLEDIDISDFDHFDYDVSTATDAVATSSLVNGDLRSLQNHRVVVGSYLSLVEYRSNNVDTFLENLQAAKSAIMDVDIAAEQSYLIIHQVLTQSSIASLAQANRMASGLLVLLR